MMILSVVLAVVFYSCVILAVGCAEPVRNPELGSRTGLVTSRCDGESVRYSGYGKVIIVGGMCGIITSSNSFMIGGSRALYLYG